LLKSQNAILRSLPLFRFPLSTSIGTRHLGWGTGFCIHSNVFRIPVSVFNITELTEEDIRTITTIVLSTWAYSNDKKLRLQIERFFMLLHSRSEKFIGVFLVLLNENWGVRGALSGA